MIAKRVGYGAEADWWSAGVMLFEMVHGYTPFTDGGTVDSENKVLAFSFRTRAPAHPLPRVTF